MNLTVPPLAPGGPRLADARRLVRLIGLWRPLRVMADDAIGRGHAWRISGGWDEGQRRWEIRLDPGYVNGQEVLCPPQPLDELPEPTLDRLGLRSGDGSGSARAWLSERPSLGISRFRRVGTDAAALAVETEEVPAYFLDRGVVPPDAVSTQGQTLTRQATDSGETASTRRLLRCADVVLNQPRPSASLDVGDDGRPLARISLPRDPAPFLTVQPDRFQPRGEALSIQDSLAGVLDDDGLDRLLIGRLWLLSPPGLGHGSAPGPAWEAHGQNFVFFHLDHDSRTEVDLVEPFEIPPQSPLAGGVGIPSIRAITDEMRRDDAFAAAFLSRVRVEGAFRTI